MRNIKAIMKTSTITKIDAQKCKILNPRPRMMDQNSKEKNNHEEKLKRSKLVQ